jgi:drug/metabolite transporter (DMT)-like permease
MSSTVVGVVFGLAATVAFEVGYLLLAAQARRVEAPSGPGLGFLRALARRGWWLTAMALNGVAFALELVALRHVSLLVVQPLLGLGQVGLVVASKRVLGERIGARQIVAAATVGGGVVLVLIGAPVGARSGRLGHGVASLIVVGVLGLVLAASYVRRAGSPWALVAAAAAGDTLVALGANEVARAWTGQPGVALAGIATVGVCGLASVTSESAALQRLPASRVGPIVSSVQVVLPVVLVALLGHAHWSSTPAGGGVLAAGVALVGAGTYVLGDSAAVQALGANRG